MSCNCGPGVAITPFGCCGVCGEIPAVREEGPPGPLGPEPGIPVFEIGTVTDGPEPSVTINQITPLLYTIDFVLPSAPTSSANTWSATQTFAVAAIFNGGFTASDDCAIDANLDVTGTISGVDQTLSGNLTVNGQIQSVSGAFTGDLSVGSNLSVGGTSNFLGVVTFATTPNLGIVALTANENVRGQVVLDHNDVLKFVTNSGYTARGSAAATGLANVPSTTGDVAICDPLVVTVPVLTPNQPTPVVDIEAIIMYEGGGSTDDLTFSLWNGAIGSGSALQFWDIAIPGNESKQCAIRVCNAPLTVGANNFRLSGDNNSAAVDVTITKIVWNLRN